MMAYELFIQFVCPSRIPAFENLTATSMGRGAISGLKELRARFGVTAVNAYAFDEIIFNRARCNGSR